MERTWWSLLIYTLALQKMWHLRIAMQSTVQMSDKSMMITFVEGSFKRHHPTDLKIDHINCFYYFSTNRASPTTLCSRSFLLLSILLQWTVLWVFWHSIHKVSQHKLNEYHASWIYSRSNWPSFAEEWSDVTVTYLLWKSLSCHVATVCSHILDPLNAPLNYFNDCQMKVQNDGLCQLHSHNFTKKNTHS